MSILNFQAITSEVKCCLLPAVLVFFWGGEPNTLFLFYGLGNGGRKRSNTLPRFMLLAGDTASSNPGRLALESPGVSLGYADKQQQPESIIFHLNAKQRKHKQNCLLRGYSE